MKQVIEIQYETLRALDKLVKNGVRGTHLLFSNVMIREAFSQDRPLEILADLELSKRVQRALEELLQLENLEERQDLIESLEPQVRDILVHIYFCFLDRCLVGNRCGPEVLN